MALIQNYSPMRMKLSREKEHVFIAIIVHYIAGLDAKRASGLILS
jgi:hypothetical protein